MTWIISKIITEILCSILCVCVCIHIYIYIEREREREYTERDREVLDGAFNG